MWRLSIAASFLGAPYDKPENELGDLTANKLGAKLLSQIDLNAVDVLLGETFNPDFRSPTLSQWSLFHMNQTKPSFDIVTGGISLAFLSKYFLHEAISYSTIGYLCVQVFDDNNFDQKIFQSGGVLATFSKLSGEFILRESQVIQTTIPYPISGQIPCFKKSYLSVNKNRMSQVKEQLLRMIPGDYLDTQSVILPDYFENNEGSHLPPQVDIFIKLKSSKSKKNVVVELSCDSTVGITFLERIE
ncbi:MAG: hypothetical protein NZT61_01855 [Deltaproteobacteria bacterium]|nr:hypothetical protein [Deltaproteobacteria bacterium]